MRSSALILPISCAGAILGGLHAAWDHSHALSPPIPIKSPDSTLSAPSNPSSDQSDQSDPAGTSSNPDPKTSAVGIDGAVIAARSEFDAGRLRKARDAFKAALARDLDAQSYSAAQQGLALTDLFQRLLEIVPSHPFADGSKLYEVTLPNGADELARINDPKAERLDLRIRDGRVLSVLRNRLKKLEPVSRGEFQERLVRELSAREKELGTEANPIEVFRTIVAFCVEYGLSDQAFKALGDALRAPSGGVLIDLFLDGDTAPYHLARARMLGVTDLAQLDSIASKSPVFANRPPRPSVPPVDPARPAIEKRPENSGSPRETTGAGPGQGSGDASSAAGTEPPVSKPSEPKPSPRTPPKPKQDLDVLLKDPRWIKADGLYRQGLNIYRKSFGAGGAEAAVIKESRGFFEQAQALLFELSDEPAFEDSATLERRAVEIQQLIYDCVKRQKL